MRCSIVRAASSCARRTTACQRRWRCCTACSKPSRQSLSDCSRGSSLHMTLHRADQVATVRALRAATPYIRLYKGKMFVVKVGGAAFADPELTFALMEQIAILHYPRGACRAGARWRSAAHRADGSHGCPNTDGAGSAHHRRRNRSRRPQGCSWTFNTRILAICRNLEIRAVGLSGVEAGLVRAHRRPP